MKHFVWLPNKPLWEKWFTNRIRKTCHTDNSLKVCSEEERLDTLLWSIMCVHFHYQRHTCSRLQHCWLVDQNIVQPLFLSWLIWYVYTNPAGDLSYWSIALSFFWVGKRKIWMHAGYVLCLVCRQIAWLGKYLAGARDNIEKSDPDAPDSPPVPPPTCLGAGAGALVSALAARTGSLGRRDIRGQCPVQCLSLTWHQEVRRHVYTSRVHLYFEVCFCYEFSQYSEFGGKWGMF